MGCMKRSIINFMLITLCSYSEVPGMHKRAFEKVDQDDSFYSLHATKRRTLPMDQLAGQLISLGHRDQEKLDRELITLCYRETCQDEPSLRPIKNLLLAGANPNAYHGSVKSRALHYACGNGNKGLAELLLFHGGNPDQADTNGRIPLEVAMDKKDKNVCKLLILKGIALSKEKNEWTTLLNAVRKGKMALCQLLVEPDYQAHYTLIHRNNKDALKLCLAEALIIAVQNNNEELCSFLLSKNANPNVKDLQGLTALFFAATMGSQALCRLLLAHRADACVIDNRWRTALFDAAYGGYTEVCKLLINHNVDVTARSRDGQTALFGAARNGHADIVLLLVEKGIDITLKDTRGQSALWVSAEEGHLPVCELLIERGAPLDMDHAAIASLRNEQVKEFLRSKKGIEKSWVSYTLLNFLEQLGC